MIMAVHSGCINLTLKVRDYDLQLPKDVWLEGGGGLSRWPIETSSYAIYYYSVSFEYCN